MPALPKESKPGWSSSGKCSRWRIHLAASIGYTLNFFFVYTGKRESSTCHGLRYSAVMDLLPFPLLGGGYTLHGDNFYTSPALFTDLSEKNIGCCGTIRNNRIGFPQTQINDLLKKAEGRDIRWTCSRKLLFVKRMDTREVTMCSTVHQAYSGQTAWRKVKEAGVWQIKSIPVTDSIVDLEWQHGWWGFVWCTDRILQRPPQDNEVVQDFLFLFFCFFYHFVDVTVVNSYLYTRSCSSWGRPPPRQSHSFGDSLSRKSKITSSKRKNFMQNLDVLGAGGLSHFFDEILQNLQKPEKTQKMSLSKLNTLCLTTFNAHR